VDPWAVIGLAACCNGPCKSFDQNGIIDGVLACWAGVPRVVARGTDTQHRAHRPHRMCFLVVLDEGEDVAFRAEVNAMAFF
jgi:hypothetical protein